MSEWQSLTLASIFPGTAATIAGLKAEADDLLNKYGSLVSQMNSKVMALSAITGSAGDMATALTSSGFYMLPLEPAAGDWQARIAAAGGSAPSHLGACAGIVILVQGVDAAALATQYASLSAILTSPISVPK